jgi:lantibiotic modifying enzyme
MGSYFYPGMAGVALFLAAMERVSAGDGEYRDLCLRALAPLRRDLPKVVRNPAQARGFAHLLGGMSGLGSLIYALLKIGILLGEPALIRDAQDVSLLITPSRILEDENLDVMFGTAGALLALLALDREAPGPNAQGLTPLDLADACAARLLNARTRRVGRLQVWPLGSAQTPLGGFAHGASGITCALLRLFGRTREPELLVAAQDGIAHERTLYVSADCNWRISWKPEARFVRSWCNGAPGIALGRLEVLDFEADSEALGEIQEALEIMSSPELDEDDFLCCGNMGRVDVLLQAACKLRDETLGAAARALACRILERAKERQGFGLMASTRHLFDPRFFLGLTGIGYTLLRLHDPLGLPCVLTLE